LSGRQTGCGRSASPATSVNGYGGACNAAERIEPVARAVMERRDSPDEQLFEAVGQAALDDPQLAPFVEVASDDFFVVLGDALALPFAGGCVVLRRDVLEVGGSAVVDKELVGIETVDERPEQLVRRQVVLEGEEELLIAPPEAR
jgi:hypothetical protein